MIALLIIAVLLGLLPASIARSKGHSFMAWWMYGGSIHRGPAPRAAYEIGRSGD
jgi:hypothetical protein